MPSFSFIKHGSDSDPSVEMTFESDCLDVVRENFEDFVRGAGFYTETELDEAKSISDSFAPLPEEEWDWTDSIEFLNSFSIEK